MNKVSLWVVSILVSLLAVALVRSGYLYYLNYSVLPPVITNTDKVATSNENNKQTVLKYSADETTFFTEYSEKNSDGGTKYVFSAPDKKSDSMIVIFETTEFSDVQYILPGNSWSPDNKQFFIIKKTPDKETYLVFKADGSLYKDGSKYYDIAELWSKTKYTSKITTATGWGGDDLIILKTELIDGPKGPDFWFVTSTKGFLQLRQL